MRTFDEISKDINQARGVNDANALFHCASELDDLTTQEAEAWAHGARGWAFLLQGDHPIALEHHHHALAIHEQYGDRRGLAATLGNTGSIYDSQGDYPSALENFHRALALYEELEDHNGVATVTCSIGNVCNDTGDYPSALRHYYRAQALFEESGNRAGLAVVTGNIGIVYDRTSTYPAALEQYQRALALHEEIGNRIGVANVNGNIGSVLSKTGDSHKALEYFNRALAMDEELGYRQAVTNTLANILNTYVLLNSDDEARELLATMDAMQIDDPTVRIMRDRQRAILQQRSGELDLADATLKYVLQEANEHGLRQNAADTHRALRDLAQARNDFAGYIEHNNEFTRIIEEVNGKDTAAKLATQEAERRIATERQEHQKHLAVLHSTLPKHIADRVARGETVNDQHDNAAVLFLDIVGFTTLSDQLSSLEVVQLLDIVFSKLDAACKKHGVVKIKTIGDSYMAVAFPMESSSSEQRAASTALDMLKAVSHILPDLPEGLLANLLKDLPEGLQVRIGLHCGPVTAGVIGTERMQYDVWGDTVNVASRMESTSSPGRIHVSEAFATALRGERAKERKSESAVIPNVSEEPSASSPLPVPCSLLERGALEIKGKGTMTTYWLESPLP